MQTFEFTPRQLEARKMMGQDFQYFMLFGGSRSGKTVLAVYCVIIRALKAAKSRHVILRFRFNAVKQSIVLSTFPEVMRMCFPDIKYELNKTDYIITFANGAEIWFGGLDDRERTEKILGLEFSTIYLNECSQIPYSSVGLVITRLAQNCKQADGVPLKLRMIFDCNPPAKSHYSYQMFVKFLDPETKRDLPNKELYGSIQMNPRHNLANLPASYIKTLEGLPPHLRRRFLDGDFKDANPNAIFSEESIDRWRVDDSADLPTMVRIVVGVDPSGAGDNDNEDNDAIGIYVAGLGDDGIVYLLEDATIKAAPATWGKMACSAYHRHSADIMVAEVNYGGAMVKHVIQSCDRQVNYKTVTASRGKVQRAEPFSPLFHDGRIRIVGRQNNLEEELGGFSNAGYIGANSPNVADAAIWCCAELFPSVVGKRKRQQAEPMLIPSVSGWK